MQLDEISALMANAAETRSRNIAALGNQRIPEV
jgi:hypothetical protein